MTDNNKQTNQPGKMINRSQIWYISILLIFITALLTFTLLPHTVSAQTDRAVQIIESSLEANQGHYYTLRNLEVGQVLYVYAEGFSGNLDPITALSKASDDVDALTEQFWQDVNVQVANGRDPIIVVEEVAELLFLAWDDDSGAGYDSSFEYVIPESGDYHLLVTSPPINRSFGDYRLQIGINAPEVGEGNGESTGHTLAHFDRRASGTDTSVQQINRSLTLENNSTFIYLKDMKPGTFLYVYVEPTFGNLIPTITLKDFGGKPVRSDNLLGDKRTAAIEYIFDETGRNYFLEIAACQNCEEETAGDFRLLVGTNAQEVLSGEAQITGGEILRLPINVDIGVWIAQITGVDQKAENFDVVSTLSMRWSEEGYAFSPQTCDCNLKTFTGNSFNDFVESVEGRWPEFSILNQQGNRWTQNKIVAVEPDGKTAFLERFTTTLQAPDFNFRQFPFDSQDFYLRILSVFPEEFYTFSAPEADSGFGEQLGEEEWVITEYDVSVESNTSQATRSQFNLHFKAKRNLTFYIVRFFIPLGLIITVSWITFFLKDYTRRIEVTTGNLLLFIAWSFTLSDDLPRLGYMTFMDAILMTTFLISVIVVIFNVILKRLEVTGQEGIAFKIDNYTLWIYPIIYAIAFGVIVYMFFIRGF